jgi:hypothetical protein
MNAYDFKLNENSIPFVLRIASSPRRFFISSACLLSCCAVKTSSGRFDRKCVRQSASSSTAVFVVWSSGLVLAPRVTGSLGPREGGHTTSFLTTNLLETRPSPSTFFAYPPQSERGLTPGRRRESRLVSTRQQFDTLPYFQTGFV